ncbi:unnamed protein product, partial [Lymnaea stagnalis]
MLRPCNENSSSSNRSCGECGDPGLFQILINITSDIRGYACTLTDTEDVFILRDNEETTANPYPEDKTQKSYPKSTLPSSFAPSKNIPTKTAIPSTWPSTTTTTNIPSTSGIHSTWPSTTTTNIPSTSGIHSTR